MKYLILIIATLTSINVSAADSTSSIEAPAKPVVQTYLLAHGQASTYVDNYNIKIVTTNERCFVNTSPH